MKATLLSIDGLTAGQRQLLEIAEAHQHGYIRVDGDSLVADCLNLVTRGLLVRLSYYEFCLPD